jgi:hypothetical protein
MGNPTVNMIYQRLWGLMALVSGFDTGVRIVSLTSPRVYATKVLAIGTGAVNYTAIMIGPRISSQIVNSDGTNKGNYTVMQIGHP